jgi:hypothetical protein
LKRPAVSVAIRALNQERSLPQLAARLPHDIDEIVIVNGDSVDTPLKWPVGCGRKRCRSVKPVMAGKRRAVRYLSGVGRHHRPAQRRRQQRSGQDPSISVQSSPARISRKDLDSSQVVAARISQRFSDSAIGPELAGQYLVYAFCRRSTATLPNGVTDPKSRR